MKHPRAWIAALAVTACLFGVAATLAVQSMPAPQGQVIYQTTGTSTAPACQDLARQYGDDGLTCP